MVQSSTGLVTLGYVKNWLGITDTSGDATLIPLIVAASRSVQNMLARGSNLGFRNVVETRSGTGTKFMLMKQWPVLSVSALSIDGSAIQVQTSPPFGTGFFFEPWNTNDDIQGHQKIWVEQYYNFCRARQNVMITYTAGYQVQGEAWTIPSSAPLQITTLRPWFSDQGVIYTSSGMSFVYVPYAASLVLSVGQYTINPATGIYQFATADEGVSVSITYSYTPEDLAQAVCQYVAWVFSGRSRIGITTKSLGGQETMSYSQAAMDKITMAMVQPFMDVIPLE